LRETFSLSASDRLLIIAPHPDDESIAAGGLLQVAKAAGAAVRVLVFTDGDNNPWPQRWIEKRWRIDAASRARWGARRRVEAETALKVLGIALSDVRFLALPDMGITNILMRDDAAVASVLRAEAEAFKPNLLVAPAPSDRHPDHSAAFLLATRACSQARVNVPRVLTFAVHGDAVADADVVVVLAPAQQRLKHEAIRAHASQMRLSQSRFLKFAKADEAYRWLAQPPARDEAIPIRAQASDGVLVVDIDSRGWRGSVRDLHLFIAADTDDLAVRRTLALHGDAPAIIDAISSAMVGVAQLRQQNGNVTVTLPWTTATRNGFVKVARTRQGIWVFDRFGWQPIA
jgi:LmbE family N-acetylglucosaminyl deacetylase